MLTLDNIGGPSSSASSSNVFDERMSVDEGALNIVAENVSESVNLADDRELILAANLTESENRDSDVRLNQMMELDKEDENTEGVLRLKRRGSSENVLHQVPDLKSKSKSKSKSWMNKNGDEGWADFSKPSTSSTGNYERGESAPLFKTPKPGTPVALNSSKRAGPYLLGPPIGTSPVKSIVQCLARKEGSDKFYTIKILTLKDQEDSETQDDRQGKMLLHAEYSLLSLLHSQDGVVHHHGFFKVIDNEIFYLFLSFRQKIFD